MPKVAKVNFPKDDPQVAGHTFPAQWIPEDKLDEARGRRWTEWYRHHRLTMVEVATTGHYNTERVGKVERLEKCIRRISTL